MIKRNPLAISIAAAVSFQTCAGFAIAGDNRHLLPVKGIEFTATAAPVGDAEQSTAYTSSSAVVTLLNGQKKTFPLAYNVLYSSGDDVGGWKAGTVVDKSGAPMLALRDDASKDLAYGPFYARSPDANSLMVKGDEIYLVTHFEYDTEVPSATDPNTSVSLYGQLPMVMNLASIRQKHNGDLSAIGLKNVSMNNVEGLWIPCAGELTPWNTHIGGEEYEPDARTYENRPLTPMNRFLETAGQTVAQGGANAYNYGLAVEVDVAKKDKRYKADTAVTKHYAMGRLANELAHVMPDRRTVYKGDDGRDVILAMFVADKEGDLSAGTLYAAQLTQTDGSHGGKFSISWIKLGHATDKDIKGMIDGGIKFSDIFDAVSKTTYQANPAAYPDYRPVFVYTGTDGTNSNMLEYLRVKPGMEQAAAFLETRRYAGYMGATAEFTKMEGETSNAADKKLYVAMSYVQKGMLDGQNADRPRDDIRLTDAAADLECGIVYESDLAGGQKDTAGEMIRSRWVATDMQALITGAMKPAAQTGYGKYDKCDTDKMANPDNIKYSEAMRTLFIGEDSGNHMNNFLWAYNVDRKTLTRIGSNRFGAEWTGLQAVDNMDGFAYIMSNVQHPGATEDTAAYRAPMTADSIDFDAFRAKVDQRGAVGYLGGLPAVQVIKGK
jgi:secreted PhoX family phosphatase